MAKRSRSRYDSSAFSSDQLTSPDCCSLLQSDRVVLTQCMSQEEKCDDDHRYWHSSIASNEMPKVLWNSPPPLQIGPLGCAVSLRSNSYFLATGSRFLPVIPRSRCFISTYFAELCQKGSPVLNTFCSVNARSIVLRLLYWLAPFRRCLLEKMITLHHIKVVVHIEGRSASSQCNQCSF